MGFDMNGWKFGCLSLVLMTFFGGCGQQSTSVADNNVDQTVSPLPLLAVPQPDDGKAKSKPTLLPKNPFKKKAATKDEDASPDVQNVPRTAEKGSPEWLLAEIQRIRLLPLPQEEAEEDEESDEEEDKPLTPAQEKKLAEEIERAKVVRRERNQQIIKLAEECIQKTNKNPEQEPLFCGAVHHLLDARFQLALQGDTASMESLYEADKVFFERNPNSESASEAALTLVNFAHANARSYGLRDPRWLKEFSKQTQSYASRFPNEAPRSVPLLMAAARTCELNKQFDEANSCYQALASKYKDTPQGQQAANSLRRLGLKGQELELAGPGIDGSEIDVRAMKGKMVLVVFWESNAQPFVQQLPKLTEITKRYKGYLTVVGVNLDTNEKSVDAFLEKHHLDWLQIFPENRQERGWNSPLAIRYGVNMLPTMFLLDPKGVVSETNLDASNLEAKIRETYEPYRKKTAASK
jgi:hypothetical protein